jgi:Ca2+-binding RTX toxin-like protein
MLGNAGTDFLQPDEGDDTVNGGEDPDIVDYFFTKPQGPMIVDLVAGIATGQGTDTLISIEGAGGGEFDDTMSGENDANGLFGFGGNDTLLGGPGNADFLQGGPGDDILDGGPGDGDTADYLSVPNPTGPVQVDLVAGSAAGHGTDSILEIERVNGTDDNDTISGSATRCSALKVTTSCRALPAMIS